MLGMLVDLAAALFIVGIIGLLAAGLIAIAGQSLGVTVRNVRQASAILGCVYVLVIWARTLRRHWIISRQGATNEPAHQPEPPGNTDAQPSTSSAN